MSSGKQMTDAERDLVIKLAFGARKMSVLDIAKKFEFSFSEETIRRVIKAYTLAKEDNEEALLQAIVKNVLSRKTVEWAYDYHAKEIPEDFYPRLNALINGQVYEELVTEQKETPADTDGQNLLALLGKLNSLGTTLCECLTAEQAKVFTKTITDCINANADIFLQELRKQTGYLESISRNIKR